MAPISMIPVAQMVDLLHECREQFAYYGRNHRAKLEDPISKVKRDDTIAKAEVNEAFVAKIDALLGTTETVRSPDTKPIDTL